MHYNVGYIYVVDRRPVGEIEHEIISAESGSDAVGKLYQRHRGVHWMSCWPVEAPAYPDQGE